MMELILFLSFCLTIIALVAIAHDDQSLAKNVTAILGDLAQGLLPSKEVSMNPHSDLEADPIADEQSKI